MNDTNERNVIRLDIGNLNQPIYRIYALNRFEELLASSDDALVNPTKWDDPFESFFLEATEVQDNSTGEIISLKNLAANWYGQCWSKKAESDAMWRIYSHNKMGVKVGTTVRKLFDNFKKVVSTAPNLQFFIGAVDYKTEAEITALMKQITFLDVAIGGQGEKFADLLCIKREAFEHEEEVRLLFQDIDPKRGVGKVFKYKLNVNGVFEEVVLDPRLEDSAASAIELKLLSAGCTLPISHSRLYRAPHFIIPIQ